jgi:SAM-dependent methyltransferase
LAQGREQLDLWVLAGARLNPSIELVQASLGPARTSLRFLDRFADDLGVERVDFNDLKGLPDDACDVLMMSRAAYMITSAEEFLDHARRILRPGGLVIVDWLHGAADAPVLDLPGVHDYGRHRASFFTTYCDPQFVAEFSREFDAFLRHVNRPPSWVDVDAPGRPHPLARRVRRLLSARRERLEITRDNCLDAMRSALGRAGKRLIEPETMAQYFTILFREARYLLTVLRPVSK